MYSGYGKAMVVAAYAVKGKSYNKR